MTTRRPDDEAQTRRAQLAYEALAREAREQEPASIDAERVLERAVLAARQAPTEASARDAREVLPAPAPRGARRAVMVSAVALAAAAVVWLVVIPERQPAPQAARRSAPVEAPAVVPPPITARVELVMGDAARVESDGRTTPLRAGDALETGARVRTAARSQLHVSLYGSTGFVLDGDAELVLGAGAALREAQVELTLVRGAITSRVDPLPSSGGLFAVVTGRHRFRVVGTHFRVSRDFGDTSDDARLTLAVTEGRVEVSEGGKVLGLVSAPGRWASEAADDVPAEEALPRPYASPGGRDGSETVTVPAHPTATELEIGGVRVPVRGLALGAVVREAPTEVIGWDGPRRLFRWTVGPEGVLRRDDASRPANPDDAPGELTPAELSAVVRAAGPRLAQCRDLASRQAGVEVVGTVALRVRISPAGIVERASLLDAAAYPATLRTCVLQEARSWKFPRPRGGAVEFTAPLSFSVARGR